MGSCSFIYFNFHFTYSYSDLIYFANDVNIAERLMLFHLFSFSFHLFSFRSVYILLIIVIYNYCWKSQAFSPIFFSFYLFSSDVLYIVNIVNIAERLMLFHFFHCVVFMLSGIFILITYSLICISFLSLYPAAAVNLEFPPVGLIKVYLILSYLILNRHSVCVWETKK